MKILMINKFLYPNGGSETYIFKLGEALTAQGHEVQYFGMEHEGRCVGNSVGAYTTDMDFHGGSKLSKLTYPVKTIYSIEARKKIRRVLDDFQPDVCHLNNFNYQLTPSIILEIVKWRGQTGRKCSIVYTAHDYQLVCPNHMLCDPNTFALCEKCIGGKYVNCIKGRCIHGSAAKSVIGAAEARYWKLRKTYKYIDKILCCSAFMKTKLDTDPLLRDKTLVLHNFIEKAEALEVRKKDYVLYFGRYTTEKGVDVLIRACRLLPDIPFVFAGSGPEAGEIARLRNAEDVGYKSGEALDRLIREARFSVCPTMVNENCPFSVLESQERGTPVVGARVGGVPELIHDFADGRLFEKGNAEQLAAIIRELWSDPQILERYTKACLELRHDSASEYAEKLVHIYSV